MMSISLVSSCYCSSFPFLSFIFFQLYPIISDYKYLEEQHLLLAIKSVDNDESYGEYRSDHSKLFTVRAFFSLKESTILP